MNIVNLTSSQEAQKDFYPTPSHILDVLCADIDYWKHKTILEPSAGKGDIVNYILKKYHKEDLGRRITIEIDCIEIDQNLRGILNYNYSKEYFNKLWGKINALRDKKAYNRETKEYGTLTSEEEVEYRALELERDILEKGKVKVIHDDFLTFQTRQPYSLIVMNPPFSVGCDHLLKAIELQQMYGGEIRCVLNAETIKNPYSQKRMLLAQKLEEYGADVQFISNGFSNSERQTDVEIAIIKINIPLIKCESEIFSRLKNKALEEFEIRESQELSVTDFFKNITTQHNVEIDSGIALIKEYEGMKKYILRDLKSDKSSPILELNVANEKYANSLKTKINAFIEGVREKYWQVLFTSPEFIGKMPTEVRDRYYKLVDELKYYEFSEFNIKKVQSEMNSELVESVKKTILKLFDKLTNEHTWYPEMQKNIHLFNGWKTNKAHKIGKKVILPVNGIFSTWASRGQAFDVTNAERILNDLECIFNYLDGNMTENVGLHSVLETNSLQGNTKNIPCKYFNVTFYKKGTMHLTFTNQALVDRFNIYCCMQRGWLPPNYGNKKYQDLEQEEKEVIKDFHSDEIQKETDLIEKYNKIVDRKNYYLGTPNGNIKLLG